jgi:hypothetical protein
MRDFRQSRQIHSLRGLLLSLVTCRWSVNLSHPRVLHHSSECYERVSSPNWHDWRKNAKWRAGQSERTGCAGNQLPHCSAKGKSDGRIRLLKDLRAVLKK